MENYASYNQREVHVKDFLIRHAKLRQITPSDVEWLRAPKLDYEKFVEKELRGS